MRKGWLGLDTNLRKEGIKEGRKKRRKEGRDRKYVYLEQG
jgi:hypothetical protein